MRRISKMTSNETITGTGDGTVSLQSLPVTEIYVSVQTASIDISLDKGSNFLTLPVGLHRLPVGQVKIIMLRGTGSWQILVHYS